mmetsp:Transcript_27301/g.39108  ORF Transcript_27301/g.39108 Transcript_27301/m.39108 type:complete len:242 (-) Transcript_27301:36-761(-)
MLQYGSDAHLENSGLCKQTSTNMLPTSLLSKVSMDSNSTYIAQCDDSDWRIGFPGGVNLARAAPIYSDSACSQGRPYEPPAICLDSNYECFDLTKTVFIDSINDKLNNLASIETNVKLNLCSGEYSWPTDAGILIRRSDKNSKLTLSLNCCGERGTCIFDGGGARFYQPLFQFEYPILFTMKAITFQNFAGNDAAIVTSKAFTVTDFQYMDIKNVVSQGVSICLSAHLRIKMIPFCYLEPN